MALNVQNAPSGRNRPAGPVLDFHISKTGQASLPDFSHRDFSLELTELKILLESKERDDVDFLTKIRSVAGSTGNDLLFPFPADRFFKPAVHVAALRLSAADETAVVYVYEKDDGRIELASGNELDDELRIFAENFANIVAALQTSLRVADYH